MATRALITPRRRPAIIRPTFLQWLLAYLAVGARPPLRFRLFRAGA